MPTFGGIVVPTGGAAADGRRTLTDIVDELSRPINVADSTVRALAGDAFRAAVRTMNRRGCWPWEIQDEDLAMTANNAYSTAVSAIKKPLAMHYLSTAAGVPDQRIDYEPFYRFVERYNQNIGGVARVYTIPNLFETGQVRWFPIPSAADNVRFTFYRVTPAPRAESEAIEVPDYAIETYVSFAWYEFLKRLPDQQKPFPIVVALNEAKEAFRQMSAHVVSPGDRSREAWW